MPLVKAIQSFNWLHSGTTVTVKPGDVVEIPDPQFRDFVRAGFVQPHSKTNEAAPVDTHYTEVKPSENSPAIERHGVTALIVNYNMPERTDALVEYIKANVKAQCEIIVIDNGSDIVKPSQYTSLRMEQNVQTCNGWMMGLHYADALAAVRGYRPEFYWFLITSAEFVEGDPLAPMLELMGQEASAVGVHPALTEDSTTRYDFMKARGKDQPRQTWFIDNIASLYRANWFDTIGRFDPSLIYAWGIDFETCWKARKAGKTIWIDERARVKKVTDIGYTMQRMKMGAEERRQCADDNMNTVLSARYGTNWKEVLWEGSQDFDETALVSVILPTYNRPELLVRALESLKIQIYTNIEAVVVNDGGRDVSEIVARYPFARYFAHKKNKGLSAARNTGIKNARGVYLAYLDDDDWYYKNHLATLVKGIKGYRAAYTNAHAIDREYDTDRYVFSNEYDPQFILRQNLFPCNTVLHEKALINEVGYFDETLPNSEDWDMWIRISKIAPWHHIPVVTCAVDRTRPTMSSDRPAMIKIFELIHARYAERSSEKIALQERQYAQFEINKTAWAKTHDQGISGCVRVCNDGEFLYPAVVSHLPYLDECVIALQPSTDNTEEVCDRLASEYSDKVRVVRYPVEPHYIHHPEWETTPENSIYSFIYLSNWALTQCRYSWIAKFESDVICLSSFQKIVDKIKAEPHKHAYYGRVLLNVAGPEYRLINAKVPCNGGWDEAVFPNNPAFSFVRAGQYESVNHNGSGRECMGWSALHLKHAKARYWGKINEPFVPFDRENVKAVMQNYLLTHEWPAADNPLGEDCLFEEGWRDYFPKEAMNEQRVLSN